MPYQYARRDTNAYAWTRVRRYSRYIRELRLWDNLDHTDRAIWLAIPEHCNGEPLFPLLHKLTVMMFQLNLSSCLPALGSTIRVLECSRNTYNFHRCLFSDATETIARIDPILLLICPPDVLNGDIPGLVPAITHQLQYTGQLAGLEELSMPASVRMQYPIIQALSTLKHLRKLSVSVTFRHADATVGVHPLHRGGFVALEELRIVGLLCDIVETLEMSASPHFRTLRADIVEVVTVPQYNVLLHSVCRVAPGLCSLSLGTSVCLVPQSVTIPIPLAVFLKQLLLLPSIQKLSVWAMLERSPSEAEAIALASAWPDLRELRFPSAQEGTSPFSALVEIARRCPKLESLCLPAIDMSQLPKASTIPRIHWSRVREVYIPTFEHATRQTLLRLALLFDRVFPCLEIPKPSYGPSYWETIFYALRQVRDLTRGHPDTQQLISNLVSSEFDLMCQEK